MQTQKRKWFFWKFIVAVIVVIVANVIETTNVYSAAYPTKTLLNDGNDIHHHHYHEHHDHYHALPSSRVNILAPTQLPPLPPQQPSSKSPAQQQQPQTQSTPSPASITKIPKKSIVAEPSMIVEQEYRPAPGEILAKDSILYSRKPGTVQLRRQLWPIMEKTMNNLAEGVTLGANNIFKSILRPSGGGDYRLQKATNIKNVLIKQHQQLPKPMAYKQKMKTITMIKKPLTLQQLPKPTIVKLKETPIGTISEDYILNYSDSPNYSIKTKPKQVNLFTDMGVTGYKHFEQTVLRELEKKEELKVEATMSALFHNNKYKDFEDHFMEHNGHHSNNNNNHGDGGIGSEWIPMSPGEIPTTENPPHPVTVLHTNANTNIVKPVHEQINDAQLVPKLIFEDSASNKLVVSIPPISPTPNYKPEQPKSLRAPTTTPMTPSSTTHTAPMPKMKQDVENFSSSLPNYPEFYLKKNKHLVPESFKMTKEDGQHQSNHNQQHHQPQQNHQQYSHSLQKTTKPKKKPKNTNNNRKETNLMKPEFMEAQASSSGIFTASPLIKSKPTAPAAIVEPKYSSVRDEQRPRRRPHRQENVHTTKTVPVQVDSAPKGNKKIKPESSARGGRGTVRFGGSNF